MDASELNILMKAKAGDNESFEILLKKYEKYIYMNTKGYYLADGEREDLIQEGIIGLLKGIKSYDSEREASFKTFVIMCMRRQIISAIKSSNSKKNKFINNLNNDLEAGYIDNNYVERSPNAEEIYIYKELMEEFREYTKEHFSDLEKKVLEKLIQGYNYGEIAKILNKSPKVIDNTYQRIKNKVKKWLNEFRNI
ncbi:sigma-70 family RNA polymerase sigma factor [Fusobacterium perfoetens]|uniref:sigma-70 family RNA polymerase sigma factor n=1 Tax=Fusobacterium perfoetens TaxID=852 RepID=UPI0004831034|nr:sigma-70 family RNA polymerase sigma factor [Fusobacterium perfoetens]MCI6153335.1 sigma-70 family RNA polymerase sigma factor [Fusobacterium perfoetens]MDY3237158.1 sigma-70 family RNA polymerase sigma factor [Fusobacterium perfoetens]